MKIKEILFSFNGRISRQTFILYGLSTVILGFILGLLAPTLLLVRIEPDTLNQIRFIIPPIMFGQLMFWVWVHLALCFKRFQDSGQPGWFGMFHTLLAIIIYILLWVVPYTDINNPENKLLILISWGYLIAAIVIPLTILYLALAPGINGPNRYGPTPE